jgi:hypothetical protein
VAYRNSTIFSMKFKAPSRLHVRCLRSRIWASSCELDVKFDSTQFQKLFFARFQLRIAKLWPFYRTTSELGFQRCGTDSDEKSGEATTMQTSRRMRSKVVAREERLKTSFAAYLGPATRRINTRRLAGQIDECIGSVCC